MVVSERFTIGKVTSTVTPETVTSAAQTTVTSPIVSAETRTAASGLPINLLITAGGIGAILIIALVVGYTYMRRKKTRQ